MQTVFQTVHKAAYVRYVVQNIFKILDTFYNNTGKTVVGNKVRY